MSTKVFLVSAILFMLTLALPVRAAEQISYASQPDAITVFLNGVAFARDTLRAPGDADVQVALPQQIIQDTLLVREGGSRVPVYTISRVTGQPILKLGRGATSDLREITLEYLTTGIGWTPLYTMGFSQSTPDAVGFDFLAQIQNDAFMLDDVAIKLAAGRVDASQQIDDISMVTMNQTLAGYQSGSSYTSSELGTGAVTIQYVYDVGSITSQPGDMLYITLLETTLPARRVLLWNAPSNLQASVIYKVRNESTIAFTEGIVRSYEDGLFVGSDFVEFTPVGSEGSVTVGSLQDVRVSRAETVTTQDLPLSDYDILHEITLEMSNYSSTEVELDVVESYPARSSEFRFEREPQREAGNILRWMVRIPAGETVTINYQYRTEY